MKYRIEYEYPEDSRVRAEVVEAEDWEAAERKFREEKGKIKVLSVFEDSATQERKDRVSEVLRRLRYRGSLDPRGRAMADAHDWIVKLRRAVVLAHLEGFEIDESLCDFRIEDICENLDYYRRLKDGTCEV